MTEVAQARDQERERVLHQLQTPANENDQRVQISNDWLDILAGAPSQAVGPQSGESGNGNTVPRETGDAGTYTAVTGTAFVNEAGATVTDSSGINMNDVRQGSLGDCYFMAVLASIARVNPQHLRDMIEDHGDGTYTVTFTVPGVIWDGSEEVTVDSKFWMSGGNPVYSKTGDSSTADGPELWVMIIEKAWAKKHGGYGNITGGSVSTDARHAVAGDAADNITPSSVTATELFNQVKEHFVDDDQPVVFWSNSPATTAMQTANVIGNHEYALRNVHSSGQTFDLYNPWGSDHLTGVDAAFIRSHFQRVRLLNLD